MKFNKPCRIVNDPGIPPAVVYCSCPGLRDLGAVYVLDVLFRDQDDGARTVLIRDGKLYIEAKEGARDHRPLVYLLPADVWQEKVTAAKIGHGLRIIMPKHMPAGEVIQVGMI